MEELIKEALKEERLMLPTKILNSETLEELERAIKSGIPIRMSTFYEKLPTTMDQNALSRISKAIEETKRTHINDDDKKVIEFLSGIRKSSPNKFFSICGTVAYLEETMDDFHKSSTYISENIRVSLMLWMYLNMYEVILDIITNDLDCYLREYSDKSKVKDYVKEIKNKMKKKEHLEAGNVERILIGVGALPQKNKSFIHAGRLFRNNVGHANLFYDAGLKQLIFRNGKRYSLEEFSDEWDALHEFILEWLYHINNKNCNVMDSINKVISELAKAFRQIQRSGDLKRNYNKIVIDWKAKSAE